MELPKDDSGKADPKSANIENEGNGTKRKGTSQAKARSKKVRPDVPRGPLSASRHKTGVSTDTCVSVQNAFETLDSYRLVHRLVETRRALQSIRLLAPATLSATRKYHIIELDPLGLPPHVPGLATHRLSAGISTR